MTLTSAAPARAAGRCLDHGLSGLIHPVDAATFERDYREKAPLVVRRDDTAYYGDLITLDDLDHVLSAMNMPESNVRLLTPGKETPLAQLAPSGAGRAAEALYDQYRKGATINVVFLHERWPALARLCRSLAAELIATVHTNVYLTPRHAQGLKPHYDTHDVFVAQIHGTKHWRLYDSPVRLPMAEQRSVVSGTGPGTPVTELDLRPGDMMYLPRGTVHDATAGDEASLHLTIGVSPLTWGAILRRALEEALASDVRLREALPRAVAGAGGLPQAQARMAQLLADVGRNAEAASLITRARRGLAGSGPPELRGHLLDLEALPSLDLDTPVRRRDGLECEVTAADGAACLDFRGKSIRMPGRVLNELRFIAGSATFTGRDIPGSLDGPGRLLLLRTLIGEGFLTRHGQGADARADG